jgi:hypothetical protein
MPDTAWVNTPRYTEEEMLEAGKRTFVSPVTGDLVTPYQLRHSHASLLLAHGVPLPDVQARLGHNDLTSTTHYVWALSEESETAAIAMNVILGYQQENAADPQQAMMAKMAAMMNCMEVTCSSGPVD